MRTTHPYGAMLRKAMTERGVSVTQLARLANVNRSFICNLRTGRCLPRVVTSARISEALDWESLHTYVLRKRTRTCSICDREFIADHKRWDLKVYCSVTCGAVGRNRVRRDSDKRRTARKSAINADRLERHMDAVKRYCWECEPVGFCATAECPLREVSPLPLRVERAA